MNTAGSKGVPRAQREHQILDAAASEIARAGYAGLSPATVAATAGVSKPLVYAYFDSKDGLYVACVQRAATVLGNAIDEAIDGPTQGMAGRTLAGIFAALEARPQDWGVVFDRSLPADGPAAQASLEARRRIADQATRGVEAVSADLELTDSDDLSALTAVWMGTVTALIEWWLRHPGESAASMTARSHRLTTALGFGSKQA
ncbi:MAG: TetR/AcrR family transcriptional regulator [Rhodococcus sp. (in: high G+C Gram-positive bacteria)]|uniref:TetR/AcrR family transcriptional regulator n=1 Tax=Rhodococcus sp. TaxID=1831 RepID=UPI002ADB642E|nr:TetR/AcrR family transcriptional regulator [Rhodococcus sp. (in: high G+C Gram-positive bacteria)]